MGGVVAIGVHSASPGIQRFTNFQWILQRRFWIFVSVNRFGLLGVQSEQLRIRDILTIRGIQGGILLRAAAPGIATRSLEYSPCIFAHCPLGPWKLRVAPKKTNHNYYFSFFSLKILFIALSNKTETVECK